MDQRGYVEVDESFPFVDGSSTDRFPKPRKFLVCLFLGFFLLVVFLALFIVFLVLYLQQADQNKDVPAELPKWPTPSLSPLGKYEKAGVACDNQYCSEIGRDVLLKGGNAVDAAVAALFCIGVMDSHSAGIGGGHFMTIYNATEKQCHVVDAREVAPLAATEDMYVDRWNQSEMGWRAIAVPADLHGTWTAYTNFGSGKIAWADLIAPTIQLLEEGYPVSYSLAEALAQKQDWILNEPTMQPFIKPNTRRVYKEGEQITTRKQLAETFKLLANSADPVDLFYRGALAANFSREFKEHGALITAEDLKNYATKIHSGNEIIYTQLKDDVKICGPPPPSGSAVAQAILNILNGYNVSLSTFDDVVNTYHRWIEAMKFAYADRSALGDPAFVKDAFELAKNITSPEYAEAIRSLITYNTHPDSYYGGSFQAAKEDHGTTNIAIIDKDGNSVSVTSTINLHFGACVMSESTGIVWNDEMDDFSTPGHPNFFGFPPSPSNYIVPGKRPQSSMSPLVFFNTKTGQPKLAVGGAGGSTIISGVSGVSWHALWTDENPKEAIDMPRIHDQFQPNITIYEHQFPQPYVDALAERGHNMYRIVENMTVVTAVQKVAENVVYANADWRKGDEVGPAGY